MVYATNANKASIITKETYKINDISHNYDFIGVPFIN